jgi:hypothetical protein
VDIADGFGGLQAPAEVLVGVVPQLAVGAHHAQVVIGYGAAALVPDALEGDERLPVVIERLDQGSLSVGQHSQILLDAAPQLGIGPTQLQRAIELLPCRVHLPTLEIEVGQRVERLGGEDWVSHLSGDLIAALTELSGDGRLVSVAVDHRQAAQRLRLNSRLGIPFRHGAGRAEAPYRVGHVAGPLVAAPIP